MITTTEKINSFDFYESLIGCAPADSLFFDIETTGLSASSAVVFLIGAVYFDGKDWLLTQWLAQSQQEEAALLCSFFEKAASYSTLIHFNGTTFDLPFLQARAKHCQLSDPLPALRSVDLYQSFRPLKKLLGLHRMNQSTLEQAVGWQREDRLTGQMMIRLYKAYTASLDPNILALLLLHNHDDMLGMTKILSLAAFSPLLMGNVETAGSSLEGGSLLIRFTLKFPLPLPYTYSGNDISPECANLSEANLNDMPHMPNAPDINCSDISHVPDTSDSDTAPEHAPHPDYMLSVTNMEGLLRIPLFTGELRYFFEDYKHYFYLPLEDQAIHRSVGLYVDKEHRIPAKPDTCYIRKTGCFLPQPGDLFQPSFRKEFSDPQRYFLYPDDGFDPETLVQYTGALLKEYFQKQHIKSGLIL